MVMVREKGVPVGQGCAVLGGAILPGLGPLALRLRERFVHHGSTDGQLPRPPLPGKGEDRNPSLAMV